MPNFIKTEDYAIEKSDIVKLFIRVFDTNKFQLVVVLKSSKSPAENVHIIFDKKEDAHKELERIISLLG